MGADLMVPLIRIIVFRDPFLPPHQLLTHICHWQKQAQLRSFPFSISASFSSKCTARLLCNFCMCIPIVKALRNSIGKKHVNVCFAQCFQTPFDHAIMSYYEFMDHLLAFLGSKHSVDTLWQNGNHTFSRLSSWAFQRMTHCRLFFFFRRKMMLSFPHPSNESHLNFLSRFYDR